jgi:hypothetical protein
MEQDKTRTWFSESQVPAAVCNMMIDGKSDLRFRQSLEKKSTRLMELPHGVGPDRRHPQFHTATVPTGRAVSMFKSFDQGPDVQGEW